MSEAEKAAAALIEFTREQVATTGDMLRDVTIAEALIAHGYRRLAEIDRAIHASFAP